MNWKFWKKPQEKEKTAKYKNTLRITLKGNQTGIYSCDHGKKWQKIRPWKRFLKWYFCRPQSENFVMKYSTGECLIKRDQIISYSIAVEQQN